MKKYILITITSIMFLSAFLWWAYCDIHKNDTSINLGNYEAPAGTEGM